MTVTIDARTLQGLLADPAAAETLSAAAGWPLIVVEVRSAADGRVLAGLDVTTVPAVLVVVARDPCWLPSGALGAADVVLTEDDAAGLAGAGSEAARAAVAGVAEGLAALGQVVTANPVTAAALVLLLRTSAGLDVPAALVAESATYSALQDGAEFRRWRASRPVRSPERACGVDRVRVERFDDEVRVTLARPSRRNAIDWQMRDALTSALGDALTGVRAGAVDRVVLCGDGPDFCAGGDLDEFGLRPDPAVAHVVRLTRGAPLLLHLLREHVVACLHGACLGAGIELPAFAAHVRAAPDARFGLPEAGFGLIPGAGGTVSLPRRIGRWRTTYLALSGQTIDARQALAWGLVDAIGPKAD